MRTLQENITKARSIMEGNTMRTPLITVANAWRDCARMGDQYLEAINSVVKAADAASKAEDPTTARRANADVGAAMRKVKGVTGKFYGNFVTGRQGMYDIAKQYGVSTKSVSTSYGKKPSDIKMQSEAQLAKAMNGSAKAMQKGLRHMLEKAAGLGGSQGKFREAAKAPEAPSKEQVAKLVEDGLSFRDSVSINVFARTNSVMRRAGEISRRNWELMMLEAGGAEGWDPPWAHDKEIGNVEA
jgi:hypothetical protein